MAKKTTKSKKVTNQQKIHLGRPIVIGVALFVLIMIVSYFAIACVPKVGHINKNYVSFSLAVLQPDRADVKDIVKFLDKESRNSRCDIGGGGNPRGYFSVREYTEDLRQLFLGYGCYSTEANMYAVKTDDGWKTISPTNQFDMHGNPSCGMVESNNISQSIAPVCWTDVANGQPPSYTVR